MALGYSLHFCTRRMNDVKNVCTNGVDVMQTHIVLNTVFGIIMYNNASDPCLCVYVCVRVCACVYAANRLRHISVVGL